MYYLIIIRCTCRFLTKISTVVRNLCLLQRFVFCQSYPTCMACFITKAKRHYRSFRRVLGPDLKLGSGGDAEDYADVSMPHISTRK
jgi:hypothetical protein